MKKIAIVTGAGKGLGRATTEKLISNNIEVIACDIDLNLLKKLKSDLGDQVTIAKVDVSDFKVIQQLFDSMNEVPDFLVNNAGIYNGRNILEYTPEDISKILDTNLKGSIYFSQLFGKTLIDQKKNGAIVNISSSSIYGGSDAVYSSSKAALVGLTKSCALNFSPYIRVNAVAPGIVLTDIFKDIPENIIKWYREQELVKDPLQAQDVANTVYFLLSEAGKNYSGAVFDLNNGFHL